MKMSSTFVDAKARMLVRTSSMDQSGAEREERKVDMHLWDSAAVKHAALLVSIALHRWHRTDYWNAPSTLGRKH